MSEFLCTQSFSMIGLSFQLHRGDTNFLIEETNSIRFFEILEGQESKNPPLLLHSFAFRQTSVTLSKTPKGSMASQIVGKKGTKSAKKRAKTWH